MLPDTLTQAKSLHRSTNTCVFRQGDPCENFVVLLSGKIKIFTRGENGKESLLYHLTAKDCCPLTSACLLGDQFYTAEAHTVEDTELLTLPKAEFKDAMENNSDFNRFVFSQLSQKFALFVHRFEQCQSKSIDERLYYFLNNHALHQPLQMTQQAIAEEIGSVREVISRKLQYLAKKGAIRLSRGKVELFHKLDLNQLNM